MSDIILLNVIYESDKKPRSLNFSTCKSVHLCFGQCLLRRLEIPPKIENDAYPRNLVGKQGVLWDRENCERNKLRLL